MASLRVWIVCSALLLAAGCSAANPAARPAGSGAAASAAPADPQAPQQPKLIDLEAGKAAVPSAGKLASVKKNALKVFYSNPKAGKQVALTFDDGPDNRTTPIILDILKRNHVKATFFLVGSRASAYPDMVKRIIGDGNAIGNHSWSHPDFARVSADTARKEIADTEATLTAIAGYEPSLFRPPYGTLKAEDEPVIAQSRMNVVDWSVDTRDWAGTPAKQILTLVRKELHPGGIILQHCSGGGTGHLANTVEALKILIPELKEEGYTFVTVPELLNLPAALPASSVKVASGNSQG